MSHANNGKCAKCAEIFDRYPGFHSGLRRWFEEFQAEHPEAHISCAGRGKAEQEADFAKGVTRARYAQSSHNYAAAIDIFEMSGDIGNIYERAWFDKMLAPAIPQWLEWYGAKGAKFPEVPHVEVRAWKDLVAKGELKLVEDKTNVA